MKKYCFNCMSEMGSGKFCGECGHSEVYENFPHHLKPGTVLNNRYLIGNFIGEGGFGITYIGRDTNLDMKVAVKEYYLSGYTNRNCDVSSGVTVTTEDQRTYFNRGKENFLQEARNIAKFSDEQGIVNVRDYFEENNTAYIVMEYLEGITLRDYLRKYGLFSADKIFELMTPLMYSLEKVHKAGIIHRDISPDNIMYMNDGTLKLMDFGAARFFSNEEKSMSVMLKQGYAPEEQYRRKGEQGPWTDVYALCATIYRCITGIVPDDALERLHNDRLKRPSTLGVKISSAQENALMNGLNVMHTNRCNNISALLALLNTEYPQSYIDNTTMYQQNATTQNMFTAPLNNTVQCDKTLSAFNDSLPIQYNNSINNVQKKKKKIIPIIVTVCGICCVLVISYLICDALIRNKLENDLFSNPYLKIPDVTEVEDTTLNTEETTDHIKRYRNMAEFIDSDDAQNSIKEEIQKFDDDDNISLEMYAEHNKVIGEIKLKWQIRDEDIEYYIDEFNELKNDPEYMSEIKDSMEWIIFYVDEDNPVIVYRVINADGSLITELEFDKTILDSE